MRPTTPGALVGAFLNLVTGLAASRDLIQTGTAHGTTWFLVDVLIVLTAAYGLTCTTVLTYQSEQHDRVKAGFARHRATPEARDLEH